MGLGFQGQQWEAWRSRGRVARTPGEGPEPSELLGMVTVTVSAFATPFPDHSPAGKMKGDLVCKALSRGLS